MSVANSPAGSGGAFCIWSIPKPLSADDTKFDRVHCTLHASLRCNTENETGVQATLHHRGEAMRTIGLRQTAASERVQFSAQNERRQKREWEEFYGEGQFVSCRAGEPVYVGGRFRSGENQSWCNGDLGGDVHRARRGRHARPSDRVEQTRQENRRQAN